MRLRSAARCCQGASRDAGWRTIPPVAASSGPRVGCRSRRRNRLRVSTLCQFVQTPGNAACQLRKRSSSTRRRAACSSSAKCALSGRSAGPRPCPARSRWDRRKGRRRRTAAPSCLAVLDLQPVDGMHQGEDGIQRCGGLLHLGEGLGGAVCLGDLGVGQLLDRPHPQRGPFRLPDWSRAGATGCRIRPPCRSRSAPRRRTGCRRSGDGDPGS